MVAEALEPVLQIRKPSFDGSIAEQLINMGFRKGVNAGIIAAREALDSEFSDDPTVAVKIAEILDVEHIEYVKVQNG